MRACRRDRNGDSSRAPLVRALASSWAGPDTIDETHEVEDDWAIIVPAGVWHNVVNTGTTELKLYSLYSPPEHPEGTVHRTKADAEAAERAG